MTPSVLQYMIKKIYCLHIISGQKKNTFPTRFFVKFCQFTVREVNCVIVIYYQFECFRIFFHIYITIKYFSRRRFYSQILQN